MPQPRPIAFDAAEEARFRAALAAAVDGSCVASDADSVSIDWVASPVGPLLIGASADAVALLEFSSSEQLGPQLERLRKQLRRPLVRATPPLLDRLRAQLTDYFAGVL